MWTTVGVYAVHRSKKFQEKLPGATTELELNVDDGDEEKPRTIYLRTKDSKNTEVGSNYEMNNKIMVSDSDITLRMGKQIKSMQTHAGASAATLPATDGSYLHDESYANSNTKYMPLHRNSYENHEDAGDASDPEILRKIVFETIPWTSQFSNCCLFQISGMMGWQKARSKKQKRKKTKKHALRPYQQQQHAATAQMLDDGEINEEYGLYTSELEHANLFDGMCKKTIYVKTWKGRTITVVIDLESEVTNLKRLVAAKTGIPTESQQLAFGGKVLTDKVLMKEYNISGGETIEMTGKLLGGMKKKSLSPRPMDTERDKKRKESEPCIEVGDSLEDENAQTHLDIDPSDNARWIEDTMKRLQDRTDDVSELETNMSGVQRQMTEVEKRLEIVSDSLIRLTEGKTEQDKKLDALLCCFKEGMEVREKKIEAKMENMEKSLSEKMNEKFSEFDKRITSIESSAVGGAGHVVGPGSSPGGWGPTPMCLKQ